MAFYSVEIWDKAFYPCVEADSPERAERIAEEWFAERYPQRMYSRYSPVATVVITLDTKSRWIV